MGVRVCVGEPVEGVGSVYTYTSVVDVTFLKKGKEVKRREEGTKERRSRFPRRQRNNFTNLQ